MSGGKKIDDDTIIFRDDTFEFSLDITDNYESFTTMRHTFKSIPVEWSRNRVKKVELEFYGRDEYIDACASKKIFEFNIDHEYESDACVELKLWLRRHGAERRAEENVCLSDINFSRDEIETSQDICVSLGPLTNREYPRLDFQVTAKLIFGSIVPCTSGCCQIDKCRCPGTLTWAKVQLFCIATPSRWKHDFLSPWELTPYQMEYLVERGAKFMLDLHHDAFTNSTYFVRIYQITEEREEEECEKDMKFFVRQMCSLLYCRAKAKRGPVRKVRRGTIRSIVKEHGINTWLSLDKWHIDRYSESSVEFRCDDDESLVRRFIDLVNQKQRPVDIEIFPGGMGAYRVCVQQNCTHTDYWTCMRNHMGGYFFQCHDDDNDQGFQYNTLSRYIHLLESLK